MYAQLPTGFVDTKAQSGYTAPMGVIFTKNGQKMFIWEKSGIVWVSNWNGSSYVKQSSPVLDISEEVGNWRDLGLHSVALDPNYDSNGLIYLFYQVDRHHLINFGTPQYSSTTDEYFQATISRVTRYKTTINGTITADIASRKILLGESKTTGIPVIFESHTGGQIIFATDGTLLVTTGDSANFTGVDVGSSNGTYFQQAINDGIMRSSENVGALRAQILNSFCGKLLRLDPNTGDGISSNPYYDFGNPRSAQSRVWALGLRNPYRISFKTGTGSSSSSAGNPGTIFVCDVQNNTWEEMHILEKGGLNCGWPIFEGIDNAIGYYDASANVSNQEESGSPSFQSLCVQANSFNISGLVSQRRITHFAPALDWGHSQDIARYPDFSSGKLVATSLGSAGSKVGGPSFGGNAGTSGTFYTGTTFPAAYQKTFFFADYGANWIKVAVAGDGNNPQISEIKSFAPGSYGKGIVDIEYCPLDGSIFYININTGDIQKISYGGSNANRPPLAAISANQTSGTSPLAVNFSSSGSSDPDGDALTYSWDFGDGSARSTSANPSHSFSSTGSQGFTVILTVSDSKGLTDSKSLVVSVNNTAPSVKITNPINNSKYTLSGPTQYALKATVSDNDPVGMQYAWQVTLRHNNHVHSEPILTQQNPTVQISPVGCDGDTYSYSISLTVTDKGGLTAKDEVIILPDCNSQSLNVLNVATTAKDAAVALTWINPSAIFDEIMITTKEGNGFTNRPSGTTYTANANFVSNGSSFDGGKVVYKAKGTSATVTGLTNGKTYYFRIFTRTGTTWTGGVEKFATPTGTATLPTTLFDPTKCYVLTARHSGLVMDVAALSLLDGAKVQQYTLNNGKNQMWRIKAVDAGYYRIISGLSGRQLDVKGASLADNAIIMQNGNNGRPNQQFKFESSGGYYYLAARHSGKYVTVSGNSTAIQAGLVQMPKTGVTSQQWTVSSVTCPTGTLALQVSQIYSADGYRDGRKGIITWVSNASDADYFILEKLDKNGNFTTFNTVNAKPLENILTKNYYSYTDNQAADGENTYRITLITDNMPPQYSNFIKLDFRTAMDFILSPNPTSEYVNVDLKPYENRPVVLTVVDLSGREVRSISIEKALKTHRVELDGLNNGQYVLRIHTDDKRDITRLFNITR
jgi:glucose/arabinose dehydrogenase